MTEGVVATTQSDEESKRQAYLERRQRKKAAAPGTKSAEKYRSQSGHSALEHAAHEAPSWDSLHGLRLPELRSAYHRPYVSEGTPSPSQMATAALSASVAPAAPTGLRTRTPSDVTVPRMPSVPRVSRVGAGQFTAVGATYCHRRELKRPSLLSIAEETSDDDHEATLGLASKLPARRSEEFLSEARSKEMLPLGSAGCAVLGVEAARESMLPEPATVRCCFDDVDASVRLSKPQSTNISGDVDRDIGKMSEVVASLLV